MKKFDNIVTEISSYFIERIESCKKAGITTEKLIIDPGVGFGKSGEDNITLLNSIESLKQVHDNVCIGSSNKKYSSRLFENIQTGGPKSSKSRNICYKHTLSCYLPKECDVELTKDTVQVISKAMSLT